MRRRLHLVLAVTCCLAAAGCGDDVDPRAPEGTGDPEAQLQTTGTDELLWRPAVLTVAAGPVAVRVDCGSNIGHEFAIDGVQGGEPLATCAPAGTGGGSVELEAGDYTFFCAVPGHREEGMEGELTVE